MMKINCDIGERGFDHPVDTALMEYIDIANIACGGHAGDNRSVRAFRDLAEQYNVEVSAHLSYPDKENFGRQTVVMPLEDLKKSLDEQYSLMVDVKMVKFHGALYNDCAGDPELAAPLSDWLKEKGISRVMTQFDSELALACTDRGIEVVAEAFAERRYTRNPKSGKLCLVGRDRDYASIHEIDTALSHSTGIAANHEVTVYLEKEGSVIQQKAELRADTICIHSDSPISLELAQALRAAFE